MTTASAAGSLRGGLACALVVGVVESALLVPRYHLQFPELCWLSVVAVGCYGLLAIALRLISGPRSPATAATALLIAMGLMAHTTLIHRHAMRDVPPRLWAVAGDAGLRLGATALVALAVHWTLTRLSSRISVSRAVGAMALLTAAAIPAAAMALCLEARRHARPGAAPRPDVPSGISPTVATRPSIVFVLIDTTRTDRLGAYGGTRPLTPILDRLSRHAVLFPESLSHASWTKPETATLLSSLHPTVHGAAAEDTALPASVLTLPEVLSAHGYRTIGFSANSSVTPAFAMDQGFEEFAHLASWDPALQAAYDLAPVRFAGEVVHLPIYLPGGFGCTADVMVDAVLDRIARQTAAPVFLYVHLVDPHSPYFAPAGHGLARKVSNYRGTQAGALHAYEQEIAFADHQTGRLLQELARRDPFRDALVVVTSDHGEEFYEHGHISHGYTLYEEQIHVPLVLQFPGGPAGTLGAGTARGIDVAPTILSAAGIAVPEPFEGQDLRAHRSNIAVFHEEDFGGVRIRALRDGGFKLITQTGRKGARTQLFDLIRDPQERRDLLRDRSLVAAQLAAELARIQGDLETLALDPATPGDDAERSLRALGYLR